MHEILLFSKNSDNIDTVKSTLKLPDFKVNVRSFSESSSTKSSGAVVIIIDLCGSVKKIDPFYKDLFKKLSGLKKPVLLILDTGKSDLVLDVLKILNTVDDIVFKKQLVKELETRLNFVIARNYDSKVPDGTIAITGLVLNTDKFELLVDGIPVELTFKEYELLKFLIENKNRVFRRNKILSAIWGYDFYGGSRTVDVHMRRLRTKLGPPYSEMLKTVRNVGYMFSPGD